MTRASLKQYGLHFVAHFSGNNLILKASGFHRLTRIGHSPQCAISLSPVVIVWYDCWVASVILGVIKCCCSTSDKKLLCFHSAKNIITFLLILPAGKKKMSHSYLGFIA